MATTNVASPLQTSVERERFLKRFVREKVIPQRFINYGRNAKLAKCIGLLGPRGSCKSLSGSAMTIIDYLIPGYDVWSNMGIQYGLNLGDYVVGYASKDLDKAEMLKLNVGHGMLFVDEINLEFSEARRSTTNRNLTFNKLIQQLRKKKLNLIYTVQHEMWVDTRLRFQTDIFIKCQDILLKPGGFRFHMDFGTIAEWTVYDMTGILGHGSYYETQKPVVTRRFHAKRWWDTFDTDQVQGEDEETYGKSKLGTFKYAQSAISLEAEGSEDDWLRSKIEALVEEHAGDNDDAVTIESDVLREYLGVSSNYWHVVAERLWDIIGGLDKKGQGTRRNPYRYIIPVTAIERPETMKRHLVKASS